MSIFLMGCYDEAKNVWCTVTKVHGGHDDKTLEKLQVKLFLFFNVIFMLLHKTICLKVLFIILAIVSYKYC